MSTEGNINFLSSWANLKIPYLRYRNPIFASNIADYDTDLLQKYPMKVDANMELDVSELYRYTSCT